jgi:hypothetical protein
LRFLACLDVVVTVLVILSTANHYVLDVIAGSLCLVIAVIGVHLARLTAGWWVRRQLQTPQHEGPQLQSPQLERIEPAAQATSESAASR